MSFDSDPIIAQLRKGLLPIEIFDGADAVKRKGQRGASVLMPLVFRHEWQVILTQRPQTMPQHPGQIAFPGGKREAGETALQAALRETDEEIGVSDHDITILGRLPSFNAVSEYRVTPFVGIVSPKAKIIPDPREVEDVFETPLSFLMEPKNHVPRDVFFEGKNHRLYDMPYNSPDGTHRNIWGMTAMIMYRLYQRSYQAVFETEY
ncbi:CoA pyrophosphatase [Hellea balneolensis]|uniref:CoA pyrophosphatase n=1 Tax=Hellea balneolensis TaxID=287478 RepID=UPI00041ADF27|nr:CoA pyrophosphatase [Hellea balneolensis]